MTQDAPARAAAAVDFDGVLRLEQALIRIPSSTFKEHAIADYLANHMSGLGFHAR